MTTPLVPPSAGGTGQTTYQNGELLIGDSTTNGLDKGTLTGGTNIAVTNGNGSITVAASGPFSGSSYSPSGALILAGSTPSSPVIADPQWVVNQTSQVMSGQYLTVTGASPNQTLVASLGGSRDNTDTFLYGGMTANVVDNAGAHFTASISGTTMTVTAISSGTITPNLFVKAAGVNDVRITAFGTGTGGTGTYILASSLTVGSESMVAYTFPTACGATMVENFAGNVAFSFAGVTTLNVNGVAIGAEFDTVNNSGAPPTSGGFGQVPPPTDFGQSTNVCIGLQLVPNGSFQSSMAMLLPNTAQSSFLDGIYIAPGGVTGRALFVDADATHGPSNAAVLRAPASGIPLQVQILGSPSGAQPLINGFSPAGSSVFALNVDGTIQNNLAALDGTTGNVFTASGIVSNTTAASGSAGGVVLTNKNYGGMFQVLSPGATVANFISVSAQATGTSPVLQSNGSDTNVNLILDTKGPLSNITFRANNTVTATFAIAGCAITGTNTNNSAAAGYVGEYISSVVLIASEVNINAQANITSISLTAGDWDVFGEVWVDTSTGAATVSGKASAGITTTSATIPTTPGDSVARNTVNSAPFSATTTTFVLPLGPVRMSLASTTTVFLVGVCNVSAGTANGYGKLAARRMR